MQERIRKVMITIIDGMSTEEIDAEIQKGVDSLKTGKVYTQEEVDAEFKKEFGR